jgi:hypothetical protein
MQTNFYHMLWIPYQTQEYLFLDHELQIQILQGQAQKFAADLLQLAFEYSFLMEIAPPQFSSIYRENLPVDLPIDFVCSMIWHIKALPTK